MDRIDATYDNLNESNRLECIRQIENIRREITESFIIFSTRKFLNIYKGYISKVS